MKIALAIAPRLPYLAVLLGGTVLALVTLRRHPRVSAVALAGYGGLLLFTLASTLLWTVLPASAWAALPPWGWTLISLSESVLGAALLATTGAAVFVDRLGARGAE